jgi:type I restriction enzyme, S subunit
MNAERLLAHYEKIADATDAIPRLRRFVLDLAVRGKLVPQDPNDEPAAELLKRIAAEKTRLVKAGEIRTRKRSEPIRRDELPIELPKNWVWARLCEIGNLSGGMTPPMNRSDFWGGDIVWLSPKDIKSDEVADSELKISLLGLTETGLELFRPGCLFMVARSGILKRTFPISINRVPAAANQDMKVLAPFMDGQERYLQIMFRGLTDFLLRKLVKTGTTVQSLKYAEFEHQFFPLAPLAEQHRIVAKADELMALIDRLEAARQTREATRDRLTAASLTRLNAPDPDTFREDARFALDALPALTARADQIKHLRQTILNLAVRGKLAPQDPNDEPASELLKRIAAESRTLMAAKGIRAQKRARPAENFEADGKIPPTWCHAYLQDLAYQITDGTHLTPKYTETGKPFLSALNVKPFRFMPDRHRFVSEADFDNYRANRRPERGDILMTRVGAGIGEAAVLDSGFEFAFYVSLCLIKVPNRLVSADYLVLWLNSPEGREGSITRTYGKGASQGNLNLGLIRTFKIPLPPRAEQHRIVAKVHELMTLCDRLEASLTGIGSTRRRLLDALLTEALAPADNRELVAAE